jgi:hypothetical protein
MGISEELNLSQRLPGPILHPQFIIWRRGRNYGRYQDYLSAQYTVLCFHAFVPSSIETVANNSFRDDGDE